jgi:uncharacterized membrane protein YdjX (TVP38/TMEM64 family)
LPEPPFIIVIMSATLRLTIVIIHALLLPLIPFVIIGELPGDQWLSATDADAFTFGMTGAGLLASDILLPIPSSIIGTLLGARLGAVVGFLWAFAGLMTGSLIGYVVGRLALARLNADLPSTPTLFLLVVSRPVPVLAEALALTAGATRVRILPFLGACAVGNVFYAAVLAANGAALLPDRLIGPGLVLPLVLPALAWLIWKYRTKE